MCICVRVCLHDHILRECFRILTCVLNYLHTTRYYETNDALFFSLSLSSFASEVSISPFFSPSSPLFFFLFRSFFFFVFYSLLLAFLFTFFRCPFHPSSFFFTFLFLFLAICTRGCGVFL